MKIINIFPAIAGLMLLSGCATEPWVKPYERANLADFNRDPISANYLHHVYDTREGARGAGIATGGGCGCN
jgi:hypothetical protein